MAKFNREKALKRIEIKKKWRNYSRYAYIAVPCVLCCFLCLYFAYSKFFVSEEQAVIRTAVGDFIHGDVVIRTYIDGKYSSTIPGKNDGYVVEKVSCDNDAIGKWSNDDWGLLTTNLTKRTKCNVHFKKPSLTEAIIVALSSNPNMFATDDQDGNIRYIGKEPNNYVYFNCSDYSNQSESTCEKWRIIGLFNNITKSDGTKENLIKIIRDEALGDFSWDYKRNGVGSSITDLGSNDWSDSQLMMMLNPTNNLKNGYVNSNDIISYNGQHIYSKMGAYYNGTKGCKPSAIAKGNTFNCTEIDFTTTGLKNDNTRNAIENVVWNLGGSSTYKDVTSSMFYERERGTVVYSNRSTTWTGKIGLMYPSDYGYATSGGQTSDRATCLGQGIYHWQDSSASDCKNNDYLFKSSYSQWTLTPNSTRAYTVFHVYSGSYVNSINVSGSVEVRPALFLKSSISISGGTGSSTEPYQLKVN